jgi:RNA polymerase sigma factor (sigma-70 family)
MKKSPSIPLDAAAQERVLSCMKLAYQLANRFARRTGVSLQDCEDAAIDALLYTAPRYDPARGANYCTFAHIWIRGRLSRLAEKRNQRPRTLSFSALSGREDDCAFDPPDQTTADAGEADDWRELLARIERLVGPKLFLLLSLYHGEGLTLEEVGQRCDGLCKESVRQLLVRARRLAWAALPYLEGER